MAGIGNDKVLIWGHVHYNIIWGHRKDSQLELGMIRCVLNALDIDVKCLCQGTYFE